MTAPPATASPGRLPLAQVQLLGAVLAGGRSTRFGTDKSMAMVAGRTLLERAVAALTPLCREVIVTGRSEAPAPCVPDRPAPGLGPLGGICAALHHAQGRALDGVVTVPVDCLGFDDEVLAALLPGPACIASLPVAGVWPVGALPLVEAILAGPPPHSLRRLAGACGARAVTSSHPLGNFNTPADLAAWENGDE